MGVVRALLYPLQKNIHPTFFLRGVRNFPNGQRGRERHEKPGGFDLFSFASNIGKVVSDLLAGGEDCLACDERHSVSDPNRSMVVE